MSEQYKRKVEILEDERKANLKEVGTGLASDFERLGKASKDIATDSYDAVKDELGGLYKQGVKKATEVEGRFEDQIRSHPLQTVLIAAGVGFILGWINRRKK